MRNILLLSILFISYTSFSQDFQWVRTFEGSYFSGENESVIEVDSNENNYTFGIIFEPIFDIDPTSGIQIIDNTPQSTNQKCSLFLTKLDVNGNFVWGKTFGYLFNYGDKVIDIEIGNDGNIYLLADIREQTSFIQKFITILKIDPNGNILMTKKITNIDNPNPYDIFSSSSLSLDSQNNIFITGSYKYHLKIDPTNPQLNFSTGGDSFLLKIDNFGSILWGKRFNVLFTNTHYEKVKINNNNEPVVVVSNGDNQSYTNYGYNIIKINQNDGTIIWQKFLDKQDPSTFNIDNLGNIVIAGSSKNPNGGAIDVDPNPSTFQITPTRYVLWLDYDGIFLDVKQYPAINAFNVFAFSKIEFDIYNNTYIVGQFNYSFDADPSNDTYPLTYICGLTSLIRDAFQIKFNNNRDFVSAFKLGDYNNNCINFYFTDFKIKNDNQYYVGNFGGSVDFDPTQNIFLETTNNQFGSRFTLKLGNCDITTPLGNPSQTFCSSQNPTIADLTPNSGIIKWYDSQTSTVQLQNTHALINGQTYYAAKQVGTCPESNDRLAVTVSIIQSPLAPNIVNQAFCENENATLSSLNVVGQNLTFYDSNHNVIPNNTILIHNETYYVSQTINNCESIKTSFTAIVNPNIIPTLTSPQQFCIQQNATLNNIAITGQNIQWYDTSTGGNLLPNTTHLQNGTTYYASQSINGCESTRVPVLVTVQNTPAPTGNPNQSFCSTENATLNNITVNGTNIIWYSNLIGTTTLPTSTLLQNGVTYYASQTINGCESISRLAVSIQLINTLNASNYSETICDELNNGLETVNLSTYNSYLISSTGNVFHYYHSFNGAQNQITSDEVQNSNNYNLSIGNNQFYVRIESPNTCFQIVTLNLTLVRKPFININDIMPICEGNSITIDAGIGYDNYNWSTSETSASIIVSQPGIYSVTVSENHGTLVCTTTKNFTVVNSNIATISEIITSDWTHDENTISVTLSLNSVGDYEYSLNGIDFQESNTFYGLENGEYTVFIRDKNGCGISSQDVYLLMYPKYFTPNGDGFNDFWKINFSENEPNLLITIFDRSGKLIKQFYSNSNGWDGTFNGKQLPSTDYWFLVRRENGIEHRGHFSLKR